MFNKNWKNRFAKELTRERQMIKMQNLIKRERVMKIAINDVVKK